MPKNPDHNVSLFTRAGLGVFFRARDARSAGFHPRDLTRAVQTGELQKFATGLYRVASAEATEQETIAMAGAAVPGAIVCLLSALYVHDIGTQIPHEVWLAIDRKARRPKALPMKVRFVRFSGVTLTYGVVALAVLGTTVKITSPARTVVDCFRYRNKIGIDVALEALKDVIRSRKTTLDELTRAAEACRASEVMRPYIEAVIS